MATYVTECATYVRTHCNAFFILLSSVYQNKRKEKSDEKCMDIKKSYGGNEVLKGISFEIAKGQIFGLLGPSGAGKTTLIKILTGQLEFEVYPAC